MFLYPLSFLDSFPNGFYRLISTFAINFIISRQYGIGWSKSDICQCLGCHSISSSSSISPRMHTGVSFQTCPRGLVFAPENCKLLPERLKVLARSMAKSFFCYAVLPFCSSIYIICTKTVRGAPVGTFSVSRQASMFMNHNNLKFFLCLFAHNFFIHVYFKCNFTSYLLPIWVFDVFLRTFNGKAFDICPHLSSPVAPNAWYDHYDKNVLEGKITRSRKILNRLATRLAIASDKTKTGLSPVVKRINTSKYDMYIYIYIRVRNIHNVHLHYSNVLRLPRVTRLTRYTDNVQPPRMNINQKPRRIQRTHHLYADVE